MSISKIVEELKADERNAEYTRRGIPPIFQLNKDAKILIIGQAPGRKVEESKIPFDDKSGEKLISWMGIDRKTFYSDKIEILPMDFYYPGKGKTGDLPPRKFIAEEYHREIMDELTDIEMTLLIGKNSMEYYLKGEMTRNLTENVKSYEAYMHKYFPIVHPSPLNFRWQAKNPWFTEEVVPVLAERVAKILGQNADS